MIDRKPYDFLYMSIYRMNVLIGCHCKKQKLRIDKYPDHGHVLHKRIFHKYGIKDIKYMNIEGCVEERDQYVNWESIPSQSVDRIWLMNCPIYCPKMRFERILDGRLKFRGEEMRLFGELFTEGWRILRPGGKIVIPGLNMDRKYEVMHFAYMIAEEAHPWKLSIKDIKDTEFHIDSPDHEIHESDYHIYYEKPTKDRKWFTRKRK